MGRMEPLRSPDTFGGNIQGPKVPTVNPAGNPKVTERRSAVETVSPAPRLEMFARRQRLGWDGKRSPGACGVGG